MTVVTTVHVENMSGASTPFWPKGGKRLIVVFVSESSTDAADYQDPCVTVHGLDPSTHRIVFWAQLRPAQRDAFIDAVREHRGPIARNENAPAAIRSAKGLLSTDPTPPDDGVVVISNPGPGDGPGPKTTTVSLSAPSRGGAGSRAATAPLSRRGAMQPPARRRARPTRRR